MSDSVQPHRRQPTRLPRPWDSPGKNTGVGCHFLLQCMKVKSLSRVQLLATPWTAAYQAPPSMGFSRQEYWSGVPLPSLSNNAQGCVKHMGCIFICNLPGTVLLNCFKFLLTSFFLAVFSRHLPWAENLSVRPSFFYHIKNFSICRICQQKSFTLKRFKN